MSNSQNSSSTTVSGGIGFIGLLQIAFIILKLLKVIEWSWVWVLAPTWGYATFIVLILIIPLIYIGILNWYARKKSKRKK